MASEPTAATPSPGSTIRRVTRNWLGHEAERDHRERMQRAVDNAVGELEAALERLRPILQNAKDGFENPPKHDDPSLNAYRREGLASGCRVGLEVIEEALRDAK